MYGMSSCNVKLNTLLQFQVDSVMSARNAPSHTKILIVQKIDTCFKLNLKQALTVILNAKYI